MQRHNPLLPRLDSLTFFTLNAMADDWESIVQIEPQVNRFHGPSTRDQIFEALRNLHNAGHLLAMDDDGNRITGYPDEQETAWFSMTEVGRVLFKENTVYYPSG